jgi:AraC-like DNA-binding protein
MLYNTSNTPKELIILPDGRIDLFLSCSDTEPYEILLLGLSTHAAQATIAAGTKIFAISFNLPAVAYILRLSVAAIANNAQNLPPDFWGFSADDMNDFAAFCEKAALKIRALLPERPDSRKMKLFELLYASQGNSTVKELSEKVFWSARQINRYFHEQYGMPLKTYCSLLRFRTSFQQIKEGKLFPEEGFADQAHFIRQIKKFSGTVPKELHRNKDGRFIQFSTLQPR